MTNLSRQYAALLKALVAEASQQRLSAFAESFDKCREPKVTRLQFLDADEIPS